MFRGCELVYNFTVFDRVGRFFAKLIHRIAGTL